MITIRAAFSEFIRDCEAGRRSPKTIRWYQDKIKPLVRVHGDDEIATISPSDLRTLFIEIDQRVSEATAAGSRRAFRAFWRWAVREYRLSHNPMKRIRPLQTRRRAPKSAASSFIAAWWQERKERQVYQREAQARIDATTNQYHDLMKELILYRAAPRFDAPVREKDGQGL